MRIKAVSFAFICTLYKVNRIIISRAPANYAKYELMNLIAINKHHIFLSKVPTSHLDIYGY